ncbi:MAG: hypothetical protein MUP68_13480 [Deltaproteobacteria bacterium]|nr:hypothetical protein [Deltaproteobacteria bacterium]
MGNLTTDMTHLYDEINALRNGRKALRKNLENGATNLKKAVNRMQAGFQYAHDEMARKTKEERTAFVSGLQKAVSCMRKDFSADLAGAHQAWFGPTLAGKMDIKREQQRKGEPGASQEKAEAGAGRKEEIQRAAVREENWSFPTLKAGSKGKRKK